MDAHMEIDTSRTQLLVEDSVWCTPNRGEDWYRLDEPELLDVLGTTAKEAFPVCWATIRPLDHADPGPYPIDWGVEDH
jgi:hypothetical protein